MAETHDLGYAFDRGRLGWYELSRIFDVEAHVVHSWITSGRMPSWAAEIARELAETVRLRRPIDVRSMCDG